MRGHTFEYCQVPNGRLFLRKHHIQQCLYSNAMQAMMDKLAHRAVLFRAIKDKIPHHAIQANTDTIRRATFSRAVKTAILHRAEGDKRCAEEDKRFAEETERRVRLQVLLCDIIYAIRNTEEDLISQCSCRRHIFLC